MVTSEKKNITLEVVDSKNCPLLGMDPFQVHRQKLRHRRCIVLEMTGDNRLVLYKRPNRHPGFPDMWAPCVNTHIRKNEACLDAISRILSKPWQGETGRAKLDSLVPATAATGLEFIYIYRFCAGTPSEFKQNKLPDSRLILDQTELGSLIRMFPELTCPTLRLIDEMGLVKKMFGAL